MSRMKSKRRKLGLMSKAKHIVSNKKSEWDQDRKESKAMKAKADEIGKQRAKYAKKKQLERDAEARYKTKYGVKGSPIKQPGTKSRTKSKPGGKKKQEYDPFGMGDFFK